MELYKSKDKWCDIENKLQLSRDSDEVAYLSHFVNTYKEILDDIAEIYKQLMGVQHSKKRHGTDLPRDLPPKPRKTKGEKEPKAKKARKSPNPRRAISSVPFNPTPTPTPQNSPRSSETEANGDDSY